MPGKICNTTPCSIPAQYSHVGGLRRNRISVLHLGTVLRHARLGDERKRIAERSGASVLRPDGIRRRNRGHIQPDELHRRHPPVSYVFGGCDLFNPGFKAGKAARVNAGTSIVYPNQSYVVPAANGTYALGPIINSDAGTLSLWVRPHKGGAAVTSRVSPRRPPTACRRRAAATSFRSCCSDHRRHAQIFADGLRRADADRVL